MVERIGVHVEKELDLVNVEISHMIGLWILGPT